MSMQPMQAAFVMPAEAFQSMQQQGMHPEVMQGMQGMQGMPMPVMMGPMGPMMAAGPMPGIMPAGVMGAPQLTQMLVDAARGGRSSNVFFKTRICNKWRAGACPYGDKCTYAHGEHELRYVPPEIVAQLEAQQKLQEAMQQRQGGGGGEQQQQQRGEEAGGGGSGAGGGGGGGGGPPQSYYKTRLCIKYMQTGYCHKAASCTFAHGYEDLRQPGTPMSPGRMPQDAMSPGRMTMPAGMAMMPPQMMMAAGRGMPMATGAMHMAMPMPMAMPGPLPGRYPGQQQQQQQQQQRMSPRGSGGYGRDEAAATRRRAATMCQIAGVGGAGAGAEEPSPTSIQAAMSDVRSGAALRESAYADSVADYMRPPGGAS